MTESTSRPEPAMARANCVFFARAGLKLLGQGVGFLGIFSNSVSDLRRETSFSISVLSAMHSMYRYVI
jgi:hypothetical protein